MTVSKISFIDWCNANKQKREAKKRKIARDRKFAEIMEVVRKGV